MNTLEILTSIGLAVSSWTLLEVIRIGRAVAVTDQKVKDLPCVTGRKSGVCTLLLALCLAASTLTAADATRTVTLAWDPNPETDIGGYVVYAGNASRSYITNYPISAQASATNYNGKPSHFQTVPLPITNDPRKWFFALTATNLAGLESDYSDEVWHEFDPLAPGKPGGVFLHLVVDLKVKVVP